MTVGLVAAFYHHTSLFLLLKHPGLPAIVYPIWTRLVCRPHISCCPLGGNVECTRGVWTSGQEMWSPPPHQNNKLNLPCRPCQGGQSWPSASSQPESSSRSSSKSGGISGHSASIMSAQLEEAYGRWLLVVAFGAVSDMQVLMHWRTVQI